MQRSNRARSKTWSWANLSFTTSSLQMSYTSGRYVVVACRGQQPVRGGCHDREEHGCDDLPGFVAVATAEDFAVGKWVGSNMTTSNTADSFASCLSPVGCPWPAWRPPASEHSDGQRRRTCSTTPSRTSSKFSSIPCQLTIQSWSSNKSSPIQLHVNSSLKK